MSNTLKYSLIGIMGVIIGVIVASLFVSEKVVVQAPVGGTTNFGGDLTVGVLTTDGTDVYGDVGIKVVRTAFTTATATPCAQLSPSATSTLVRASLQVNTATGTAITLQLATSTTAYATTTMLQTFALASGATGTFVQLGTTTDKLILAPSTYVVWGAYGIVGADTAKFLGYCTSVFQETD